MHYRIKTERGLAIEQSTSIRERKWPHLRQTDGWLFPFFWRPKGAASKVRSKQPAKQSRPTRIEQR